MTTNRPLIRTTLLRLLALLILTLAGAGAMAQTDPPARVASLSHMEGTVALAPAGDTEWTDAVLNRPITRGDRLWTDRGARAEVHLGSAVLHMDSETFLDVTALDDQVLQASLNEGTVNARVRELAAGENFEIDTPHLAFRASQPGDYRIDVDPARGTTRVTVRSGIALVYGASGEAQQLQPGQQIAFTGRDLERVAVQVSPLEDGFDRWAAARNRVEDESIAARYVPREVVGYQQLDPYGTWAEDPSYGAIWYPRITVADWAPYRYGHWEWIAPWGWTWIDDAPWGFAPFHYGRWAHIGSRWAWVPGRIGRRPIYAPALVVFVGGGSRTNWSLSIGSSPGIAWYPLAPGEAWRPTYRTSPVYVRNVNRNIVVNQSAFDAAHTFRSRGEAVTAVKVEDFRRGRPVRSHWSRVSPAEIARAPIASSQALPQPRRLADANRSAQPRSPAPTQPAPVIAGRPQPQLAAPGLLERRREPGDSGRPFFRPREETAAQQPPRRDEQRRPANMQPAQPPQVGQAGQRRPQVQQLQRLEQERARRDQQVQQERVQREQRVQLQAQRQLEDQRRAQQAQLQREHALRQQQAAQERVQRQQQAAQERVDRQQQAARERFERQQLHQQQLQQHQQQQQLQQQRALQQAQSPAARQRPQPAQPPSMGPAAQPRGDGHERAAERGRGGQGARGEARLDEEGGRGRGHGRGG